MCDVSVSVPFQSHKIDKNKSRTATMVVRIGETIFFSFILELITFEIVRLVFTNECVDAVDRFGGENVLEHRNV